MKSSSFKSPAEAPKKKIPPSASVPSSSSLSSSTAASRVAIRAVANPSPSFSTSSQSANPLETANPNSKSSSSNNTASHQTIAPPRTGVAKHSAAVAVAAGSLRTVVQSAALRSARLPRSPIPPVAAAALVTEAELAEAQQQVHELQTSCAAERERRPKLFDMLLRTLITNDAQIKHDMETRDAWIASNECRIRECEERLADLRQQRGVEALRAAELRELEDAVLREISEVESHITSCLAEKQQRLQEIAESQVAIEGARSQIADLTLQLERSRRRKEEQMASLETIKQDVQREQQKERELQETLARRKHVIAEVQRKVDRLRKPRSLVVASRR